MTPTRSAPQDGRVAIAAAILGIVMTVCAWPIAASLNPPGSNAAVLVAEVILLAFWAGWVAYAGAVLFLARGLADQRQEHVIMMEARSSTLASAGKRVFDIMAAALALLWLAPVIVAVAVSIRVRDGSPVLVRSERIGQFGRSFWMLKFRTMARDAESMSALLTALETSTRAFKLTYDPRVTPLGRLLRRTGLDELPQLWNVLRGDMSLVGPRALLPREFSEADVWKRRRLAMKPGMTGFWQLSQLEAARPPDAQRLEQYDLRYIDRWSLWLDLKIVARSLLPAIAQVVTRGANKTYR